VGAIDKGTAGVDRSYKVLKDKVGATTAEDSAFSDLQRTTWELIKGHNDEDGHEMPAITNLRKELTLKFQNPFAGASS
jgi:hypothetical protein